MELRGVEPLRPACKAGIIPLDHSPENWSRRRESNPHPFVYETNALPHELLRKELILEARGGVEPRAFPPSSYRFGLEDRCRERGRCHCRFSIANCRLVLLINSALIRTSENDKSTEIQNQSAIANWQSAMLSGRGVRPTRLCELHAPTQSPFCRDESRPDNLLFRFGAQGRTQTFNLWFVGPALRQLSYSGGKSVGIRQKALAVRTRGLFLPSACCFLLLIFGRSWNRTNLSGFSDPR